MAHREYLEWRIQVRRSYSEATERTSRDSVCRSFLLLASPDPPSYEDTTAPTDPPAVNPLGENISPTQKRRPSTVHPRVAVLLGVNANWNIPLLLCRAFSTAPSLWWGLRCALTFLGELLLSDGMASIGEAWSVEKRFRVTEVFLAILWVNRKIFFHFKLQVSSSIGAEGGHETGWLMVFAIKCLASAYLSYFFTDCLMSRW